MGGELYEEVGNAQIRCVGKNNRKEITSSLMRIMMMTKPTIIRRSVRLIKRDLEFQIHFDLFIRDTLGFTEQGRN